MSAGIAVRLKCSDAFHVLSMIKEEPWQWTVAKDKLAYNHMQKCLFCRSLSVQPAPILTEEELLMLPLPLTHAEQMHARHIS